MKTRDIILCSVFAAILCVLSVITIPIGAVPVTMSLAGVFLLSCILGAKRSAVSVLIYILLGAAGMPVFSGFKSGIGVIIGPTGGYLTSYIFMAIFIGFFTEKLPRSKPRALLLLTGVCAASLLICYTLGTLWFVTVTHKTLMQSLSVCVLPFIPFDILKCIVCACMSYEVRTSLVRAKITV